MSVRLRRVFIVLAALVAVTVIAAAAPIVAIETGCGSGTVPLAQTRGLAIGDAGYRRAEGDSYLTYPEWYIVHAYADLAGVTRQSSESRYDYARAITTF